MEISDVRVKLIEEPNDRLKAVCSITLDEVFVVRDLKVVEGTSGLFVAMPSRKLTAHCPRCRSKNHLRARFCNDCGSKLPPPRTGGGDPESRTKLHRDIAHPINTEFRELVQERVIQAFHQELELAQQPGYKPRDLEAEDEYTEAQEAVPPRFEAEPEPQHEPETGSDYEPTEYDALIAGLARGEGERPQRRPQPQHAQRSTSQGPRRSDDRGRRGGERRDDRGRGKERGQSADYGRQRGSRPAVAPAEQRPRGQRPEPRAERRAEPPRAPQAAPPPPPPPAPVPTPDDTDEAPFGAGL